MRRLIMLGGLWLAAGAAAAEADALTPAQRDQAKSWVRQLGDRSFKTREQAHEKLAELGRAARPLLEDGLKAEDNEVRCRCARLLELASRSDTEVALAAYMARKDVKALMKLPAWDRFSKLVGDSDDTRKLFVDMYCAEGPLLAELDRSPDHFVSRFRAHIQEVQRNLYTPLGQANPIPHSQVVALLFLASDPKLAADLNSFYMISNLFYQPTVQQTFKTDDGSRKMLVAYLEKHANNPNTMTQGFYIARQLQLKEAVPWAMKTVKDKTAQPNARAVAILFVGQTGNR